MTRQEYIFKHASEIAERKARTARSLQSEQAKRLLIALACFFGNLLSGMARFAKQHSDGGRREGEKT